MWAARAYARLVPPAELIVGLLLISGTVVRAAAILASAMLASFLTGMVINIVRGRPVDCGCFEPLARRRLGPWSAADDIALLAMTAAIVAASPELQAGGVVSWLPLSYVASGPSNVMTYLIGCTGAAFLLVRLLLLLHLIHSAQPLGRRRAPAVLE